MTRRFGGRVAVALVVGFAGLLQQAVAGEESVLVQPGESLWRIAGRLYPGAGLDRDRIMLALLRANPNAFTPTCNVNALLKTGARLDVPPAEQVAGIDARTARRTVERQTLEWTAHRRGGGQLECPPVVAEDAQATTRAGVESAVVPRELPGTEADLASAAPTRVAPTSTPPSDSDSDSEPEPAATPTPTPGETAGPMEPSPGHLAGSADQPCPCPASPIPSDHAGLTSRQASSPAAGEGMESRLAPGPRAPGWLLVPLLLGLITVAMLRWERRREILAGWRTPTAALESAAQLPRRALLALSLGQRESYPLLLLAALVGFLGALVTVFFREGIHGLQWLISGHNGSLVAMAMALPAWQRLLFPAVGGLVAGVILQQIGKRLGGRGTTDYMEAIAIGDGWISVRHSLMKAASSLFTVASGGSIGREGAMVQLSAMVASFLGRIGGLPRDSLRLLVAAGAAAGLASAYNAPIAATLFVAEIVLGSIAIDHIGPLIIAAVIANLTVHDLFGYAPVYDIPSFHLVSDWELGFYLVLGLIAGHMAPVFLRLLERSHHLFGRLPLPLAGRMALGGLIVGAISVYEPQVWGNGYSVVNSVLLAPWVWQALLTVLVLKMLSTAATHGSGAVGGAFTPTLFVGALLGALFGTLVHTVLPVGTAPANAYAVVGMGAMLAGTTHAPLMSILMVFEMTMDYQIVLPLMLAVITAHYTARRYTEVKPMYAESLLPRERAV